MKILHRCSFLLLFVVIPLTGYPNKNPKNSHITIVKDLSLLTDKNNRKLLHDGIFYLEIPEECKPLIEAGRLFAYGFTDDTQCKEYSDGHFGGYHDRKHNQIESFYIEKNHWEQNLSGDLQKLANHMDMLGQQILHRLLQAADLPEKLWKKATGSASLGKGQVHFSYNHYRPEKKAEGIAAHRDFGYISILYIEKPGLEALIHTTWTKIDPIEDHFVVIIGRAFEILKNNEAKVAALWHRVGQLNEERVSFAISYDNDLNSPILRFHEQEEKLEVVHTNYESYLNSCFKELYSSH